MFVCTTPRYDEIYAPWLKNAGNLLELGGYKPGDKLIDLCGGTGAVTKAALWRPHVHARNDEPRSDITLVDLNPRFDQSLTSTYVRQVKGKAEKLDLLLGPQAKAAYDLVVCRQALAYLNPRELSFAVAYVLKPGGRFVFSHFMEPRRASLKGYFHEDVPFVESHLYLFGRVIHLQARLTKHPGVDVSLFRYHSGEELRAAFSPHFDFDVKCFGRAYRWVCTRNNLNLLRRAV